MCFPLWFCCFKNENLYVECRETPCGVNQTPISNLRAPSIIEGLFSLHLLLHKPLNQGPQNYFNRHRHETHSLFGHNSCCYNWLSNCHTGEGRNTATSAWEARGAAPCRSWGENAPSFQSTKLWPHGREGEHPARRWRGEQCQAKLFHRARGIGRSRGRVWNEKKRQIE
jgi:hypothetical protein